MGTCKMLFQTSVTILFCLAAPSAAFRPSVLRSLSASRPSSVSRSPLRMQEQEAMDISLDDIMSMTEEAENAISDSAVGKQARTTMNSAAYAESMPGQTAPFGFFDPAGFCSPELSVSELKRYREAEITHGRVAMLATVGFLVGENFNPLFGGSITGPAINQFWQVPYPLWGIMGITIGILETYRAQVGWVEPGYAAANPDENTWFQLRDTYTPGDLKFDPLGLKPSTEQELAEMTSKELNNGRLAMIAIAGMVGQEVATERKF